MAEVSQQDQVLLPAYPHLKLRLCDTEQLLTLAQHHFQGQVRGGQLLSQWKDISRGQGDLQNDQASSCRNFSCDRIRWLSKKADARTSISVCCIHLQHTGNNKMNIKKEVRKVKIHWVQ